MRRAAANSRNAPPNDSTAPLQVQIKQADAKMQIVGRDSTFVGVINGEYTFNTANINVPADARYSWDFGDGTPSTLTREAQHQFKKAGAFYVLVDVTGAGVPGLHDLVTIQIAPDSAEKKSDVTFYVYRVMSSKEKQTSNYFTISIYDTNGKLVDSGQSIARNGAWDTVMQVGRPYGFEVDYKYTLPPCSGKTPRRNITIKEGLNFIEVETASCGA